MINCENICVWFVLPYQSLEAERKISKYSKKSKILILLILWLFLKIFFLYVLPYQSFKAEKEYSKNQRNPKYWFFDFLINSENIWFFGCVALPVFGSWEKNIKIIKEIKNIDCFDFLINSENNCFSYVLPYQSFEAEEKISKNHRNHKYWFFWFID